MTGTEVTDELQRSGTKVVVPAQDPKAAPKAPAQIPDITRDSETYFLLTSLTSGQSSIVTATSRLELLLIVHKIPFVAVDVATHEKAKGIWMRRAAGKRLPGIVHDGMVVGVSCCPGHSMCLKFKIIFLSLILVATSRTLKIWSNGTSTASSSSA